MDGNEDSTEMPLGVALILLLTGLGLLFASLLGWVGPALWVRVAYRPATATVLDTQPTERQGKPVTNYGLRALLAINAEGRVHRSWVTLPRETRWRDGPEADAVRAQVAVGQQVACFHDPYRPGAGMVLERPELGWGLLLGVLFPLAFLAAGAGGMATSWPRAFPRGAAAEASEMVRRLPRSFYVHVLDACAIAAAGVIWFVWARGVPGVVGLVGAFGAALAMIRLAARAGAVARPSPERLAARGPGAGHPAVGEKPARPALAAWTPPPPIGVGRGERLAVRFRRSGYGEQELAAVIFSVILGVGSLLLVASRPRPSAWGLVVVACWLSATAVSAAFWLWRARRTASLAVEISGHPLRAGRRYAIAVMHRDPAALRRLSIGLERREETSPRPGRRESPIRESSMQAMVALDDRDDESASQARRGQLAVPLGAVPSLVLGHHSVDWSLTVRFGRWSAQTVRFPVTVQGPDPGEIGVARKSPTAADEKGRLCLIWLDDGPTFHPGAMLRGGYSVGAIDGRPLESVELSVLWEAGGRRSLEMGVCHYEDRAAVEEDERTLIGAGSFRIRLPEGPPSFKGTVFKVRWRVRLRLRYADGGEFLEDLPFSLGPAGA